ncbi:hypothetical protein BDZ45DRAFT_754863 [Acephala macrosclerotiorum]|nr:hypothetical protein BDZ45DRAFT_754863 [Acephala macrosclerotiorum]
MTSNNPPSHLPRPRNKRFGRQNSLFSLWTPPGMANPKLNLKLDPENDLISFLDDKKADTQAQTKTKNEKKNTVHEQTEMEEARNHLIQAQRIRKGQPRVFYATPDGFVVVGGVDMLLHGFPLLAPVFEDDMDEVVVDGMEMLYDILSPDYGVDETWHYNEWFPKKGRVDLLTQGPRNEEDEALKKLKGFLTVSDIVDGGEPVYVQLPVPTFHPFTRLPVELQLKIWSYALPEPTTLVLKAVSSITPTININPTPSLTPPTYFFERRFREYISPVPWKRSTALLLTTYQSRQTYLRAFPHSLPFASRVKENTHRHLLPHQEREKLQNYRRGLLRFSDQDKIYLTKLDELSSEREFWAFLRSQDWVPQIKYFVVDSWFFVGLPVEKWIALLVHFKGVKRVEGVLRGLGDGSGTGIKRERYKPFMREIREEVVRRKIRRVEMPELMVREFEKRGVWACS